MTTTLETYRVERDGTTVSGLVWRRFRKPSFGMVERVLDLNRDLADLGPIIPIGTTVVIPIDPPAERRPTRPVIQLWD